MSAPAPAGPADTTTPAPPTGPSPEPPATDPAFGETAASGSGPWLLALHSSGETLGVALQRLGGQEPPRLKAFPLGRGLSGALFACVESVLPAPQWPRLGRLAVATGPGGFTGTRLTVALARTLAQQLNLPLDGVGSFRLIAQRLLSQGAVPPAPFWVVQELPRRGLVAGLYAPVRDSGGGAGPRGSGADFAWGDHRWGDPGRDPSPLELSAPRLYREASALADAEAALLPAGDEAPALRCPAEVRQPDDVAELLRFSQAAAAAGRPAPWNPVLPLYPTSPVDGAP
jgi:tRNA threonylcarbamoyladenosine biosynthesis protein TsaB